MKIDNVNRKGTVKRGYEIGIILNPNKHSLCLQGEGYLNQIKIKIVTKIFLNKIKSAPYSR